jgi:adenylate cyclase
LADVFISYARPDEPAARRLARALQNAGLNVWWDAELPAHRAYSEVIERNLAEAKAVVVLWSKASAKSQWVRAEADFARNAGKLVQAQLDGSMPPLPFNQIQCADLKGWRGGATRAGLAKLRGSVDALVAGEDRPVAGEERPSAWEQLRPYRWWAAAALVVLLAMGAWLLATRLSGDERKPVLAVLPFRSLDARDQSLVAGIWEDTRTTIGRNPQLVVLGPNSSEQIAEKGESAARKAADYVLEASVRTAGDRIRVSANLVRTRDGEQLWSQDFDRKLDDVFALQSAIAREIEGRIRGRLAEKGGKLPEHIATSGEVYALYSDARAKVRKRDVNLYSSAREQLEQVVRMDPNFAPGWATLSELHGMLLPSQKGFSTANPAEAYARKAIDLAPNLAAGHAALAFALNRKGPVARSELERAIELDPNDYEALNWLGGMLSDEGRKKDAIAIFDRAVTIEPLFWPAVFNLYGALRDSGDEQGVRKLLEREKAVGADYLARSIEMDRALQNGDLAKAANVGLEAWASGRTEARTAIGVGLWGILLQLGYGDLAFSGKMGPSPAFAADLWRDAPKGLDKVEALHMPARELLTLTPLIQNAARVALVTNRPGKIAQAYVSLGISAEQYADLFEVPDEFLAAAPVIALSLQRSGHGAQAQALLSVAERRGEVAAKSGAAADLAWLARIYAVEGRKDDALSALTSAVSRGWLPPAPMLHGDMASDPALAGLRGDARFERLRQQVLGTIARERAQVSQRLLNQLRPS